MSDYEFLKLFKSNLSLKITANNLVMLSKLTKSIVDIKLDSLLSLKYISIHELEEIYKGEPIKYTSRWGNDDTIDVQGQSYDEKFLTKYSITNTGNEFVLTERLRLSSIVWSNRRSWIALLISALALVVSAYKAFVK